MNKYQKKLAEIKARRISTKQRLKAFALFLYYVLIGLWSLPFGLMAINIFFEDYAKSGLSKWISYPVSVFSFILVVSLLYFSFQLIGKGLSQLTLCISGIKPQK